MKSNFTILYTIITALLIVGGIVFSAIAQKYSCIELEASSDGMRLKIEQVCQ